MQQEPAKLYPADPRTRWLTWGVAAPFLCLAMVIASQLAGVWMLEHFVALDRKGNPVDPVGLMGFTLIPFGLLLALLLAWTRWVERRAVLSIGITTQHAAQTFLKGHAAGLATLLLVVTGAWLSGGFASAPRAPLAAIDLLQIALLLPCIAVQSSVEELLFRGWLLSVLTEKFNLLAGVLASSALFALLHFARGQSWLATASNFLFGVFCCCCVWRWRSVVGAMGWHSGWNWLLAVGFGLPLSGLDVGIPALLVRLQPTGPTWPTWLHGGAQGPEASAACVVFFVTASILLIATKPGIALRA